MNVKPKYTEKAVGSMIGFGHCLHSSPIFAFIAIASQSKIVTGSSAEEEDEEGKYHKMLRASLVSCVQSVFEFEEYIDIIGHLHLDFGLGRKIKVKVHGLINSQTQRKPMNKAIVDSCLVPQIGSPDEAGSLTSTSVHQSSSFVSEDPDKFLETPGESFTANKTIYSEGVAAEDLVTKTLATNAVVHKDSEKFSPSNEIKNINISSCSIESGISTEIDIVGTDSSQGINQEEDGLSLGENENFSVANYSRKHPNLNWKADEQNTSQMPKSECWESESVLESESSHWTNKEHSFESKSDKLKSQSELPPQDNTSIMMCHSIIQDTAQILRSPSSVQSTSMDNNFASSPHRTSTKYSQKMDHIAPLRSHIVNHPLDMSVLKSKPDEYTQRTEQAKDSKMFSLDEEIQIISSDSVSTAKRKISTPHGGDDAGNECAASKYSSVPPRKLQKCCVEPVTENGGGEKDRYAAAESVCSIETSKVENNFQPLHTEKSNNLKELDVCHVDETTYKANSEETQEENSGIKSSNKNHLKENKSDFDNHWIDDNQANTSSFVKNFNKIHQQKSSAKVTIPHHVIASSSTTWSIQHGQGSTNSPSGCTSSIPWQRRDMSRKEEYEFLEMNPFCDLAEFSNRHPHVHQRTYYRWKRRIKEEFMILEQCPDMSFSQFSGVVLQAKENVFSHWKSLISQGKGFFAPSDSSKRLETKISTSQEQQQNTEEYTFLQKNLSATFLDFSQQFPGASLSFFNTLKQKSLQEFALFHQKKHMSYKEFSKLVNISEDVFTEWQACVQSLSQLQGALSPMVPGSSLNPIANFKSLESNGFDRKSHLLTMPTALKKPLPTSILNENSVLPTINESMTHSLSASYLASLQNLMFPWPGYYGLGPQLAPQHLLPFMLWPGVMGSLAGASSAGHLALLSQLQSVSTNSSPTSAPQGLQDCMNSSSGIVEPKHANIDACLKKQNDQSAKNENPKAHKLYGDLKIPCTNKMLSPHQTDKEESNDSSAYGALNRSRKQNLQEYIHYLYKPELGFRELETLFPSISSRTFYRWRKEMNAAVLLIEEKPDMEFVNFHTVFPDIPEEIFHIWQGRAKNGEPVLHPSTVINKTDASESRNNHDVMSTLDPSPCPKYQQNQRFSPEINPQAPAEESKPHFLNNVTSTKHASLDGPSLAHHKKSNSSSNISSDDGCIHPFVNQFPFGEEQAQQKKCYKEDYLYVQQNPALDFATFSRHFPHTSVRTFYRWKKELRDAVEYLRCNPTVDYASYKAMDATVSEEVFDVWKAVVKNNFVFGENVMQEESLQDMSPVHTDENYNTALSYLHLNPSITYAEFTQLFPQVTVNTFEVWKEETNQLIKYIQANPNVQFSDISSLLPNVSQTSFAQWKEAAERDLNNEQNDLSSPNANPTPSQCNVEFTKSQMTKAFVHLMYNPTISFKNYQAKFEFVSPSTFELWLNKIRAVIVDIMSKPNMTYDDFNIKDMSPDLFDKLRSFGPQDLSLLDDRCKEAREAQDETTDTYHLPMETGNTQTSWRAIAFLQTHPSVSWKDFHSLHPSITLNEYLKWNAYITEQIDFIKENIDLSFSAFTKYYPHTSREVFSFWKRDVCSPGLQNDSHHFLGKVQHCTEEDLIQNEHRNMSDLSVAGKKKIENLSKHVSTVGKRDKSFDGTESSLSKLTKFASVPVVSTSLDSIGNHYQSAAPENEMCKNFKDQRDSHKQTSPVASLQVSGPSLVINHHLNSYQSTGTTYSDMSPNPESIEAHCSPLKHSSSSSLSLSALVSLNGGSNSYSRKSRNQQILSPEPEKVVPCIAPSSTSIPWHNHIQSQSHQMNPDEAVGGRDEDEAFSSQRQKKMSRAEYMFVKANPEVDSQEFSRIFPGVSARTFYRWKKEIRAQMQLS
ncbi:hypothetical protein PoB_005232400 [Plakobranchus ocellatus]|uniref:Vertnin n=1 Tax=Plakobranchus ocellatus TaxID=259542 RepID=A0AAV4BZY5_9GAST|nr:hypothetical protein PoB_005232400 [Plakobranchus ocellatus]